MDKDQPEEWWQRRSHLLPRFDHDGASALVLDSQDELRQASDELQLQDFEDEDELPALPHLMGRGPGRA